MQRRLMVTDVHDPSGATHVVVRGDDDVPMAEVHDALATFAPKGAPLFLGDAPFPTEGAFRDTALVDGDQVSWNGPLPPAALEPPWTPVELRVVGGPAAGRVVPLAPGTHDVGRAGLIAVPEDDMISRRHLRLVVDQETVTIQDLGSANGTYLEGAEVTAAQPLPLGAVVQAGATLVQVVPTTVAEIELTSQADGRRGFHRKFRLGEDPLPGDVTFPAEPEPSEPPRYSAVLLAPVVGGVLVLLLGYGLAALAFLGLTSVLGLAVVAGSRIQHRKHVDRLLETYQRKATDATARLLDARAEEVDHLRRRHPDPAATVQCARAAGRLLWSHRSAASDPFELRIGSGAVPSQIRAIGDATDDGSLGMAPVTVALATARGIGIVGDPAWGRGVARNLVLQAATYRSPSDLRIVVLVEGNNGEADWDWVRWLPHARWAAEENFVLVGTDASSMTARLQELKTIIARRNEGAAGQDLPPTVLVVYDGVTRALAVGFGEVMREGPAANVYAICVDRAQSPEMCDVVVTSGIDGDDSRVEERGRPLRDGVIVDAVAASTCAVAARCLAPLRLVGEEAPGELPSQIRLLDLLDLDGPTADSVARLWSTTTRTSAAPVGVSASGPLVVDLAHDGPHAVVAGASRSGKSELLKTWIASLAARNHPDDLAFVFIDAKGGNDYQVAATLPHTVDLVILDSTSTLDRSLQLLEAEIVRRQRITRTLQASTLDGYWAAQASQPAGTTPVMGRLVVVVDEFAELAQRHPLELERLLSVVRAGAAYGVHLVLATQRPGGAISQQLDANVPLRICFRTTTQYDSTDVLGSPVAADLAERHRGRGYKRSHQERPVELQSARIGNPRPGADGGAAPLQVIPEPWATLGQLSIERGFGEVTDVETDFYDLAHAIRGAAVATGWTGSAVPWPKPLPPVVPLEQLPPAAGDGPLGLPFALVDDPAHQAHRLAVIELGSGPVAFGGSSGTGRTTALRTIAASAASRFGPDRLHLYAIEMAASGLAALAELPHCGGVSSADTEVARRILDHIEAQLRQRRQALDAAGASDLDELEQGSPDEPWPWIALLVDGWEILHEDAQTAAGSEFHDRLLRVLSEGQRLRVQGVIAGDRWALSGRAGRLATHRLALHFNSEVDYDTVGLRASRVPGTMPPGRALSMESRVHQIAVLGDGSGSGQTDALRRLARRVEEAAADIEPERRPLQVQPLPTKVMLSTLTAAAPPPTEGVPVLLGVSASSQGGPVWIDLAAESPTFMITGGRRSGRSTALLTMARSALSAGVEVVVLSPRPSPISQLVDAPGVRAVHLDDAATTADLAGLTTGPRVLVVADDVEYLDPRHHGLNELRTPPRGWAVVVAMTTESAKYQAFGFLNGFRRTRSGLILCPDSVFDGGAIGTGNLPRHFLFTEPPGRAVLSLRGELSVVQVAAPE